jgi:single-stranded-DNA-specific exonuclease
MQKNWNILKQGDTDIAEKLAKELGIDKILAKLLIQKGIDTFDKAKAFFRPNLDDLHDPFLMKDMDKALERIDKAFSAKEKILIYGDYDVDGTTAVAMVYSFFKRMYKDVDYYIPDRYNEGYGVSFQSIDFASKNNISLIISLDCGIKDAAKIKYAKEKNIDFIICDHHLPSDIMPEAYAILNPKRIDCEYPFKDLSGCGVGFKLLQAYAEKHYLSFEDIEEYLDLVAVSIASDIVSVTGENRILAYFGVKKINSNPRAGLEAILKCSNLTRTDDKSEVQNANIFKKELNLNDLAYMIGPRINAAGRIESGTKAVELLICDDLNYANVLALYINSNNNTRKNLDTKITSEAIRFIENDPYLKTSKSTVIYQPEWHIGVLGIVASRLIESYYRPTIVLTDKNGLLVGSARSVKNFDIYEAIDSCSDLLEHFGGHKCAAGLSLKPENLKNFILRFEDIVVKTIDHQPLVPEIEIDAGLDFHNITPKFVRILKQFAPFGPDNMSPTFVTSNVKDTGYASIVGNNHLKLSLTQPNLSDQVYGGIAFSQAQLYESLSSNKLFNICYSIEENEWNGNTTIQLNIKDIKFN